MDSKTADSRPVVLTIAGLDPSGGAGIVADIKTIAAFGCFPTAALTSITFQNTSGVFGALHQSGGTLRAQVEPILEDFSIAAVKTGMLPTKEIVGEVARLCRETKLPAPVVDPVMCSTTGQDLIDDDAFKAIQVELLPLACVITPNVPEAERLVGFSIAKESDMRRAAEAIRALGARAVLIKGGHLRDRRQMEEGGRQEPGKVGEALDVLLDEAGKFTVFREHFVDVGEVHGSGCTLSAAIAACLAIQMNLEEAIQAAKSFVTEAIRAAPRMGRGARPL